MTADIFSSHWGLFSCAITIRSLLRFHRDHYRNARREARKLGKYDPENSVENLCRIDVWKHIANEHAEAFSSVRMLAEEFRDNLSQEAIDEIRNFFATNDAYNINSQEG